ncbi:MAG TPA: oxidoreductase [Bacteroidetes bacterium]|nr:oxidoreductase [Bacteroidota bacterium]
MAANRNFANVNFFNMVKIGVIGAGQLGQMHIQCIQNIPEFALVGFMDDDDARASKIEKEFGIHRFLNTDAFFDQVDAIDILVPTQTHFQLASRAIKASKHVFIEKPLAHTLDEARELVELAYEGNVHIQVGHRERFNPALLQAIQYDLRPSFIEVKHHAVFDPFQNVNVVMDLMLPDIDIVLSLIRSNVKKIRAFGLNTDGDSPDMVNARIEFDNGCVVSLSASRIAEREESTMCVYEKHRYVTIDYLNQHSEQFLFKQGLDSVNPLTVATTNALKNGLNTKKTGTYGMVEHELGLFKESINSNLSTAINVQDGYNALNIAFQILEKIQSKANIR